MTIAPVTVRAASPADLAAVYPLAVAFYSEDGFTTAPQVLRANLAALLSAPSARVAVARSAQGLFGFAVTTTSFGLENGLIAELEDLYVVPWARRLGLGSLLVEDSATWAREQGCRHLELVIAPNGGDVGHLFDYYLARGFRNHDRRLISRPL